MEVVYGSTEAFVSGPNGVPVQVRIGTHWSADDPVVVLNPGCFTDDPTVGMSRSVDAPRPLAIFVGPQPEENPMIEQATAAPGEQRDTRRTDVSAGELEQLRHEARKLGINVDLRWGIGRLRQEIADV